jgi:plasmid stability protein
VKNITVSVPELVYRRARVRAAEHDTSVSGLVRAYLESLASEESNFERRRRLQDEVLSSVTRFRAGGRMRRDAAHDRDALR